MHRNPKNGFDYLIKKGGKMLRAKTKFEKQGHLNGVGK